jgi:hypothetical protein
MSYYLSNTLASTWDYLKCFIFWEVLQRMFLTKRYFKNFQYGVVGFCVFAAALVGSVQTAFIIREVGKAKKAGRKQANGKK